MSQSHLVVDFPIKGPAIAKALPEELPPLMPDLARAQDDLGTVHFSRFIVEGDEKLSSFRTLTARSTSMSSGSWSVPARCSTPSSNTWTTLRPRPWLDNRRAGDQMAEASGPGAY